MQESPDNLTILRVGVQLKHSVLPMQCIQMIVRCVVVVHACNSVAENWQLNPEFDSWQLLAFTFFFCFGSYHQTCLKQKLLTIV